MLGLKLIASAVMVVGLVAFAPLIADAYGIDDLTLPLRLIAIAVAAQADSASRSNPQAHATRHCGR